MSDDFDNAIITARWIEVLKLFQSCTPPAAMIATRRKNGSTTFNTSTGLNVK
jgi:hypothetical protein